MAHNPFAVRRLVRIITTLATVGTAAQACAGGGPAPVQYTAYQLTCCTQADIEQVWQPGTTVDLHWIVQTSTVTTTSPGHQVVMSAVLLGPYSDVQQLKQAKGGTNAVQGSIIRMDDRVGPTTSPVSIFILPADLPTGYYNLTFKADFGGGSSAGGASIVRVGTQ